jgi:hypothetical protein
LNPIASSTNPEEGLLRMFARDGCVLVRCAVSKAALVALEDDALAGPHAMILTYRRNKERVRAIAQRKYRQRRFEARKAVVIRLEDLGQDPAWRSVAERAPRVPYLDKSYQIVPRPPAPRVMALETSLALAEKPDRSQ